MCCLLALLGPRLFQSTLGEVCAGIDLRIQCLYMKSYDVLAKVRRPCYN